MADRNVSKAASPALGADSGLGDEIIETTTERSAEPRGTDTGSARDRAFEKLLRSDPELLRSLVDQAADALCLHEIDGRILDVNRLMCTTLGYSRDELLARTVFDIDVDATREVS